MSNNLFYSKEQNEPYIGRIIIAIILITIITIVLTAILNPIYALWAAQYTKKIQVEEALGKKLAAIELAQAEIERAKGVAEANRIISNSITTEYIKYRFVEGLNDGNTEVIYVPTEANLPILEAREK